MNICNKCLNKFDRYWHSNYKMLHICENCMKQLVLINPKLSDGYDFVEPESNEDNEYDCGC